MGFVLLLAGFNESDLLRNLYMNYKNPKAFMCTLVHFCKAFKGAFKYYISRFSQILDPPPQKCLYCIHNISISGHILDHNPPKRAYIILERSLKGAGLGGLDP